jgi:hypothetical protein
VVDEPADDLPPRSYGTSIGWIIALSVAGATAVAYGARLLKGQAGDVSDSSDTPASGTPDPEREEPSTTVNAGALTTESTAAEPVPRVDRARIKAKVERAFRLVPEIGKGWRWYDFPYRLLTWLLTSWRRELLPWRLRYRLNNVRNFFSAFNHYQRLKVEPLDDPMENLIVPADEDVTQGGIWVMEFFPPSFYSKLTDALKKNGWDKPSLMYGVDGTTNAEQITLARRKHGSMWTLLGAVLDPRSHYFGIDAKRELLPEEFDLIQLTAVQVGQSLTAVTAFIRPSDMGRSALNRVWKAQHEPTFEWRGLRPPHSESRHFAALRAGQRERKRLHDLARSWLADRCGGYFAATKAGQPVVDFNMFAVFDPTSAGPTLEFLEPLRALGMAGDHLCNYTSPQLPGGVFVQGESLRPYDDEDLRNCWGLVGAHEVFSDRNDRLGYGDKPHSATTLAAMSDSAIRSFLLNLAVVRYTEQLGETFSDARDTAQNKHREFKPKQVDQLRRELLTTSLDLPVVARDTALLWQPAWRQWNGIDVNAEPIPGDTYPATPFDLIETFRERCSEAFDQLVKDDSAYRDVLSTVSALGASAAANRLGRRALFVSGTSLLVSVTAVLTARDAAAWDLLLQSFSDLWNLRFSDLWNLWFHHGTHQPHS